MIENENNEYEEELIEATDEDGNKVLLQVLDYFFYNGEEYAVLAEPEDEEADGCEACESCEACEMEECDAPMQCYVCKVVSGTDEDGTEMDEFIPVEDDALAEKLIEIANQKMAEDEEPED